jgi:DivIVA domain-containing protein
VTLFLLLVALAVLGAVAAVAAGLITGGLDDPASSVPQHELPPGPLRPDHVEELRFAGALRGYRMDQVDAALDRVREELGRRDAELAAREQELEQLRRPGAPPGAPGSGSWPAQRPRARKDEWPLPGVGRIYDVEH